MDRDMGQVVCPLTWKNFEQHFLYYVRCCWLHLNSKQHDGPLLWKSQISKSFMLQTAFVYGNRNNWEKNYVTSALKT